MSIRSPTIALVSEWAEILFNASRIMSGFGLPMKYGSTPVAFVTSAAKAPGTLGLLYGINVLGASLGALLTPWLLVRFLGIRGAVLAAAGANLLAAGTALLAGRLAAAAEPPAQETPIPQARSENASLGRWMLLYGLSGFCALALEIDFRRLLERFRSEAFVLRAYYYTAVTDEHEVSSLRPLIDWLDYNGFAVVTKPAKEFTDSEGRRKVKGNMDIELAVDAMDLASYFDHLVLFSGDGDFVPLVAACPGCGRTTSTTFQELAAEIQGFIRESMPAWKTRYPGVEMLSVAVMGCIVNGPGESKHADIGISLPGTGEQPTAPVFIDGKKAATLRGPTLAADFKKMVLDYIERRWGTPESPTRASSPAQEEACSI